MRIGLNVQVMCRWSRKTRNAAFSARRALLLCVSLALAIGSTASRAEEAESDSALLERAAKYWEARVARSREVLDFYAPPEKGGPKTARDRSEFGNVKYRAATIQGADIDGDQALVRILITAGFPLITPIKLDKDFWDREIREEWIKVDGIWYKKAIPLGFSRPSPNKRSNSAASSTAKKATPSPEAEQEP